MNCGIVAKRFVVFDGVFGIFDQGRRPSVPMTTTTATCSRGDAEWNSVATTAGMKMMRHRLRIFTGEDDTAQENNENVTVKLGDISQALIDATRWNRTWVSDFADDEIQVSSDLYQILSTYIRMRPGA